MGLDMYLEKRIYVGGQFKHQEVKGTVYITKGEENREIEIPVNQLAEVQLQVGYWRKANAIHQWFVKNVQDGIDECQGAPVTYKQLVTLRDLCKSILDLWGSDDGEMKKLIKKNLPPTAGFFFGPSDVDSDGAFQWYIQDLKDTINIVDAIEDPGENNYDITFTYQSSW